MRTRLVAPSALLTSAGVHGLALVFGAWLVSQSFAPRHERASNGAAPLELGVELTPLELPEVAGQGTSAALDPTRLDMDPWAVQGGGTRLRPRPDLEQAGRGGTREGAEASNFASSVDPLTLDRDPYSHDRSQVQRLRTSRERRTLEDRRATPSPMQLELVVTGSGRLHERRPRARANPALGAQSGAEPSAQGAALGGARPEPGSGPEAPEGAARAGADERALQAGIARGAKSRDFRASAAVVLARPWVPRARPAVPSEQRGRQNDTADSSQEVASRVASLIHASTAGGDEKSGVGGDARPGPAGASGTSGAGSRSSAQGSAFGGDISSDPGLAGYHDGILRRLDRVLADAFPKWAILEGRSGRVIFELLLLKDGRVADVRIVRPSGIDEYDRNVLAGVRRLGSVDPLPALYGDRALIRIDRDSLNLVVGRDGPGPGGRGK